MIINETYVNDSVIARMSFVPQIEWRGDGTKIHEVNSYADILTVSGSQIQVRCTKEQYMVGLNSLSNKTTQTPDIDQYERLTSILDNINEGLGEYQTVSEVQCPYNILSFKKAQEEIEELIHDLEILE